jgi:hypothetical protein
MRRSAKPAKAKGEAKPAVARKSPRDDGQVPRALDNRRDALDGERSGAMSGMVR